MARTTAALLTVLLVGADIGAQELHTARDGYFRVVGSYFRIAPSEVAILSDWDLPPDEIPVVLFIAHRAGISPEALVALRRSGRSWVELTARYSIGASALYLPLREGASPGVLTAAYDAFRASPVGEWQSIRLAETEIVALINIRVLSEALGVPAEDAFRLTSRTSSFVELYELLVH